MIMLLYIVYLIVLLILLTILIIIFYPSDSSALIIITPQYDFCKGGSMAIQDADKIIKKISQFRQEEDFISDTVIIKKWHLENHISFSSRFNKKPFTKIRCNLSKYFKNANITYEQSLFPNNCVFYSHGAEIHHDLLVKSSDLQIHIGRNRDIDSYSGFGDKFNQKFEITELDWFLKFKCIKTIFICGLYTEDCLQATAIEAKKRGYKVIVLKNLTKGLSDKETEIAFKRMENHGILFEDYIPEL